jgi:biotin-dependent carboxylase-like uncharacterized protein
MIKVLKPGFYTTVQDSGRFGYRNIGVPVAGAMDLIAYKNGNDLLGNPSNAASLEITMTGPTLLFAVKTAIVITGAEISPQLNDKPISNNQIIEVQKGDIISFGKLIRGFRAYLAVSGGFQTEEIMGSRSFMMNITTKDRLKKNMTLQIDEVDKIGMNTTIQHKFESEYLTNQELRAFKGPEFEMLTKHQKGQILQTAFTVSKDNNRMAYQLTELITPHKHNMITSAAIPGTIQLTPEGKLIILMRDGQTTGGYIRILQLTEKSVSVLAQKKSNDTIKLSF